MRYIFIALISLVTTKIFSQQSLTFIVKDSSTNELLPGATITLKGTSTGISTDKNGKAIFKNNLVGNHTLEFFFIGYKAQSQTFTFPILDTLKQITILLVTETENLEEVIVSSSRTNSHIDDLNTKVEVLGQDDMDEESTVVPGSITSILGDLSIITIQRTNPVNGNDAIRMQGLDPR